MSAMENPATYNRHASAAQKFADRLMCGDLAKYEAANHRAMMQMHATLALAAATMTVSDNVDGVAVAIP
jgi:hypothetical protein